MRKWTFVAAIAVALVAPPVRAADKKAQQAPRKPQQEQTEPAPDPYAAAVSALSPFQTALLMCSMESTTKFAVTQHQEHSITISDLADQIPELAKSGSVSPLFAVNADRIAQFVRGMNLAGMDKTDRLGKLASLPIAMYNRGGGAVLMISGLAYLPTFNTLQTTGPVRARAVAEAIAVPQAGVAAAALKGSGIAEVGFCVNFESKNFGMSKMMQIADTWPEEVLVVLPLDAAEQFAATSITAKELLKRGALFLNDRNMGGMQKIDVE